MCMYISNAHVEVYTLLKGLSYNAHVNYIPLSYPRSVIKKQKSDRSKKYGFLFILFQ